MDFEAARANMIDQQIRPWNVLDLQTLNALGRIRREDFVPEDYRNLAFADVQIPLGDGEVMLEPKVSARMMESLHLEPTDKVLEVGTGSGYVTALLCLIASHVTSVDINPAWLAQAKRNLGITGLQNFTLEEGDAHDGWGESGAFDAILVSGSVTRMPDKMLAGLAQDGRLVGIEGHWPAMQAVLYQHTNEGIIRRSLFETNAPRLKNAEDRPEFVF